MKYHALLIAAFAVGFTVVASATDYYVDSIDGNDLNSGTSAASAWRSLEKINAVATDLKGGDRVLFRRGGEWRGLLRPGSGEKGKPLVYTTYGKGPKPIFEQSVDRSKPEDWLPIGPGLWSTRRTKPEVGRVFWRGREAAQTWSGSFQEGAKGSVKVLEENGVPFTRITLDAAASRRAASTLQVWGPQVGDLTATVVLRMKIRASKPTAFPNSVMRIGLNRPPWTGAVSGILKGISQAPVGSEWREVTAVMERGGDPSLNKGYFHWSIGDVVQPGTHVDIQMVELCEAKLDRAAFIDRDVGILILDHGKAWGMKKLWGPHEVQFDRDFWYDPEEGTVVMKSYENPGARYASIELAKTAHVISEGGCHDVTYDGLAVRYGAAHGFGGGSTENIVIRNCDIYWIGGGLQYWRTKPNGERYPVRYGNGIEFWGTCKNNLVERNRLWQVYDAALTNQTKDDPRHEVGVVWRDNVIWQAEYSFEYWNHDPRSYTGDVVFEHNTCVDAGYCWSHAQRPNPNGAHLMFYDNAAPTTNFVVRYNVFVRTTDRSTRMVNDWRAKNAVAHDGLEMHDNLYWTPENAVYEYHPAGRDRRANPAVKPLRFGAGKAEFAKYVAETGLDRGSVSVETKFRDEERRDYRFTKPILCPDGTVYGARNIPGLDEEQ